MSNVKNLERQVQELSRDELAAFRSWFVNYDWEAWDEQLEQDVANGKLDSFAEKALQDHASGKTTEI